MRNKGLVVKIKDSHCIILTSDGTYHKLPRSRVINPTVGANSEFTPVNWVNRLKPVLMVACLLVAMLSLNFYQMAASADPVAYVSLDINPSIELGVDENSKIVTVRALNKDAENLLRDLDIKGMDLYIATRQIIEGAASSGYIKPEEENYILSTVTPVDNSSNVIDYDKMADNLQKSIEDKDLDVNFVILSADKKLRQEAINKGISAGKLLVYKNSVDSGKKLSLEQVKQSSVTTLIRNNKVLLLPGKKKGFVKMIRVPRKYGHQKKSGSASGNDTPSINPELTTPVGEVTDQDKTPKAKEIIRPKKSKINKDKTDTSPPDNTKKKNSSLEVKQGGKAKGRPADPVKGIDKESQSKTIKEDIREEDRNYETKSDSLAKQKNPDNKKTSDHQKNKDTRDNKSKNVDDSASSTNS